MKLKKIAVTVIFFFSIIFSTIIINKFDKYEISSDSKQNHILIKSDILRFWKEADNIKKNFETGEKIYKLGGQYYSSFLPPKITALYYIIISEDIFLENDYGKNVKQKIKSNNKKIFLIYFQILIFFFSVLFFYNSIKKKIGKSSKIILFFLLLEPTMHQFNYSFHSESIFFSILILLFSFIIRNNDNKYTFFLIGLLSGLLYLQRSISIFYFLPIVIFFILEKKNKLLILSYIFGLFLIISFLGIHNYTRSGILHFTPSQSKVDIYLYLIPNILKNKNSEIAKEELSEINNKIVSFRNDKNLNLQNEKDMFLYRSFIKDLSIKYILKNPAETLQVIIKKNMHSIIFNPFEIYSFYNYEYKPDNSNLQFYKSSEHKFLLKIRIVYSAIIYFTCAIGFFSMLKVRKLKNLQIFLCLSLLYYIGIGGWHGNPRYLSTNLIFLSIFFGLGFFEIKNFILKKFYRANV